MSCITIPAIAAVPAVPSRLESFNSLAWDGGANSQLELGGNVRAMFQMNAVVGVVVGFTQDRSSVERRSRLTHGFYFYQTVGGALRYQVLESMVARTPGVVYTAGDTFQIRRINGVVSYLRNGTQVYRSTAPSAGTLSVGAALFSEGDAVLCANPFFEVINNAYVDGVFSGVFGVQLNSGQGIPAEGGEFVGGLFLSLDGVLDGTFGSEAPTVPSMFDGTAFMHGEFEGYGFFGSTTEGDFGLLGNMAGTDLTLFDGAFGAGGELLEVAPVVAYASVLEQDAVIIAYGGLLFDLVEEGFMVSGASLGAQTAVRRDVLGAADVGPTLSDAMNSIDDGFVLGKQLSSILMNLVDEGFTFDDSSEASPEAIERVINQLLVSGVVSSYSEAVSAIVTALAFGSLADAMALASATDNIEIDDVLQSLLEATSAAVEALLFSDAPSSASATAMVLVNESMLVDDALVSTGEFASLISESIGFVTHLTLDTGDYVAWVLNTESSGVSTYSNYPFNSFAKVGGAYYGATSAGLFALEGDSDDGVPIVAKLRLGLSDMGNRKLKRLPEAYIGYTSNGTLLLRVITVDDFSGDKIACVYKLAPRGATNIRENRFQMGRGIKAVDWDFEIENVDGADFDLTSVEFNPLIMDRRTRG